uniref:Uncharacterized protein n=1 Tax=Steinernema glaseri TaxID=37863 RepID=A0A1I7Z3F1_9BILA
MWIPIAIFLVLLSSNGVTADCNFDTCYAGMKKSLKLEVDQPWSHPELFRPEIEMYYKTSETLDGVRKVCQAFRAFRTCMGDDYRSCMTPAKVSGLGVTPKAAYEFVSVFSQLHYVCGAGLNVFVNGAVCMKNTWSHSDRALDEALIKFNTKAENDPSNVCTYGNELVNKFSTTFWMQCRDAKVYPRDVEFWGCEYARIYVFNRYPQCAIRCSIPSSGGIIG